MPDMAQVAYEAYCESIGVEPKWHEVGVKARSAWDAVAQAVMAAV